MKCRSDKERVKENTMMKGDLGSSPIDGSRRML